MKKAGLYGRILIAAALTVAGLLFTGRSAVQGQTFTTSGSFVVPAGVTRLIVECWGGGGGGGFARSVNGAAGGGGGGGGYTISVVDVTPGQITYTVGAGGSGGRANGTAAGPGGTTSFSSATPVVAAGGAPGTGMSTSGGGTGGTGGTGGNFNGGSGADGIGGTGGSATGGGGGGSAGVSSNGNNGSGGTGGAAVAGGGAGGSGAYGSAGGAGTLPGGGGAGGHRTSSNRAGGNGAGGQVRITIPVYFYTGTGEPSSTGSWVNPLGVNPPDFTSDYQIFIIQNGQTASATSTWTVSGNQVRLIIQNGATLTENASINIGASVTLRIEDGGRLNHNTNSTVVFGGTNEFGPASTVSYGRSGTQTVVAATYGNLVLTGTSAKSLSAGITVNGTLSLEGTASATGSTPLYGVNATLQYAGSAAQTSGSELPNSFSGSGGVVMNNPSGLTLSKNAQVTTILTMASGNILTGTYTLTLSNQSSASLVYNSGTIVGRFIRRVGTPVNIDYLFPVGTVDYYRGAVMNFSSLSGSADITAEFVASPPSGFLPYDDGGVVLNNLFLEGYWRFSASTARNANYSLSLTAQGFTSFPLTLFTRISGRDNGNTTWRGLGNHGTLSGGIITRTGISGTLNTVFFEYALASECGPPAFGYNYEREITIDHNRVAGGEDLFNFPILVRLSGESYLRTAPSGQVFSSNGYDIIFADEERNKLDHQIERYNGATGDLTAWVRIPRLSASQNTVIRIMYGNATVNTDPSVTTVWDSHYKGVWHFNDSNLGDATSYGSSGTAYNSPTYPAGQINNSLGLNGSNQYVQVINAPHTNFVGDITVSAWVYMGAGGRDQKIAGNQNGSAGGYKFGIYTNNKVEFEIRNAGNTPSLNRDVGGGTTLSTGTWYYLAGVSSDVLNSIMTFVNGVRERPFTKNGILGKSSDNITIGREPFSSSFYFNGRFDELRISDKVRSDGWLRTEYYNQSSPSTFYSVGPEVSLTRLPSASICNVPITLPAGSPAGGTYSGNPYISGNQFNPPAPGTYTIIYGYTGACGTVNIEKEIVITPRPGMPDATDQVYCTGMIANLVASSGENIKWYSGGTLVSTANPFTTGLTAPGTYTYTVTQSVNGCESEPREVRLTILTSAAILEQPSAATICEGNDAVFSVSVLGHNVTCQWQENSVNISDGALFSGVNTPTLTVRNPGTGKSGALYRCRITSSCGPAQTSNTGLLTVTPRPVADFSYPGNPYCPNASNPLPVFTGGGIAGIFSSSPGLSFVSSSTGQVNLSASIPGIYTVKNTIAASGGCDAVEAEAPFEIITGRLWLGTGSVSWNDPANWTCGLLPDISTPTEIPDVLLRPVLSGGPPGATGNLTIATGSSLIISGNSLAVGGSINNNGSIDATDGGLIFNGSVQQTIPAHTFVSDRIKDLTIDNPAGVVLSGSLGVSGIVTLANGELSAGGHLTLLSDTSGTALISGSGNGTVSGNVTMQRYLPTAFGYKYFSSPFAGATVAQFHDEPITLLYRYDENRLYGGLPVSGWTDYNNASNVLYPLTGYAVNFGSDAAPKTVDITGTVNSGPLSLTLFNHNHPFTQGFNLVGNPYPSPVDWDLIKLGNSNIDDAIYFFNSSTSDEYGGTYSSYVAGVPVNGQVSNIIPSMQGFFVHVSIGVYPVTGSLVMNNSVRVNDFSQAFAYKSGSGERDLLRLTAGFSHIPGFSDPLVIYTDEKANTWFDKPLDALKLFNTDLSVPSFYSYGSDGIKMSINGIPPEFADTGTVALGLSTYIDGEIALELKDANGRFGYEKIWFLDTERGIRTEMEEGSVYKVHLQSGDYVNRFFIQFAGTPTGLPENTDLPFRAYYSHGVLRVIIGQLENNQGLLSISNMLGQSLFSVTVYEEGYHEYNQVLKSGIYIVSLITGNRRMSQKIFIGE